MSSVLLDVKGARRDHLTALREKLGRLEHEAAGLRATCPRWALSHEAP